MGRNGGFRWNQPRRHAHLANAKETTSETHTPEVRGLNKEEIESLRSLLNTMEKPSGHALLLKMVKF
uniref:Uncharacterized protein n=1 Tax=Salix viminalis TaxID=40686 RepID=A0A6N2LBY7_SALVM